MLVPGPGRTIVSGCAVGERRGSGVVMSISILLVGTVFVRIVIVSRFFSVYKHLIFRLSRTQPRTLAVSAFYAK